MLTLVLMLLLQPNIAISQNSKCKNRGGAGDADWVILYKGPAQNTDALANWVNGAAAVTDRAGHSFAATLTDVVGNNNNDVKFLAYNNVPPGIPNVKTKSNGKGIIVIRTTVGENDGAWIVHTVPGFPAARTGYSWPASEVAKGHLLICMTIAKSQINAIAASLFHAEPFVYYNDIPETETAGMPDFKKLAEGQIPTIPPFTIIRSIKLTGAGAVPVHIYSKSAKSRYESSHNPFTNDFLEIYKKVILKGLKKTIKVWSRRDNKLKGDCRVPERNIRLIKSPAQIGPTQANGKVLLSTAPGNWDNGAAPLTEPRGHSFVGSLTGVVADAQDIKFLAYNNVPPAVPKVQTKSNSKGVIIVSTAARANEGRWIVHTVPGFPAAKT
ncbi:Deoxyribonuclease-2-alpha, partial [Trichinella murrelli]